MIQCCALPCFPGIFAVEFKYQSVESELLKMLEIFGPHGGIRGDPLEVQMQIIFSHDEVPVLIFLLGFVREKIYHIKTVFSTGDLWSGRLGIDLKLREVFFRTAFFSENRKKKCFFYKKNVSKSAGECIFVIGFICEQTKGKFYECNE